MKAALKLLKLLLLVIGVVSILAVQPQVSAQQASEIQPTLTLDESLDESPADRISEASRGVSLLCGIGLLAMALFGYPAGREGKKARQDRTACVVNFVVAGAAACGVALDRGASDILQLALVYFVAGMAGSVQASAGRTRLVFGTFAMLLIRFGIGGIANLLAQVCLNTFINPWGVVAGGMGAVFYGLTAQLLAPFQREPGDPAGRMEPSPDGQGKIPMTNKAFEALCDRLGFGPVVVGVMNAAPGAMIAMVLQTLAYLVNR